MQKNIFLAPFFEMVIGQFVFIPKKIFPFNVHKEKTKKQIRLADVVQNYSRTRFRWKKFYLKVKLNVLSGYHRIH